MDHGIFPNSLSLGTAPGLTTVVIHHWGLDGSRDSFGIFTPVLVTLVALGLVTTCQGQIGSSSKKVWQP